jgi:ATP-dependent DNA helicase RecG
LSANQRAPVARRSAPQPAAARAAGKGGRVSRAEQLFGRLGLTRDWDFLLHVPQRYRDEATLTAIADLAAGEEAQVEAVVQSSRIAFRGRRQLVATLRDDTGEVVVRLMHFYPSHQGLLAVGRRVRAMGLVRGGLAGFEMVHPQLRAPPAQADLSAEARSGKADLSAEAHNGKADLSAEARSAKAEPPALTPVYPTTAGLPQSWLRRRIDRALQSDAMADTLPEAVRLQQGLAELACTLRTIHHPPLDADVQALLERRHPVWERLKFDELLAQQLALRIARQRRQQRAAPAAGPDPEHAGLSRRLLQALPFALTAAQQRVWAEVERDLAGQVPMNRLIQGDVGSGKTVIAALAAARAIESGWQAALMAPTELLAEQHFDRIDQWLAPLGIEAVWLTGRLRASGRRAALQALRQGQARLAIGTHALVQPEVRFSKLGLAIVDEQHRFGVAQRLALRDPSFAPHLLMLSATPIPRTLAMTYLADLDVSVIDQLPPGRQPVATRLVARRRRDEVLQKIRAEVAAGRQAYWVCPAIEEGADPETSAATRVFEDIRASLPQLRIGLLHGELAPQERTDTMRSFAQGRIDVLVATTVVEVGVDVPNANLMVIEHAERFGLATLHQLRGRIGRGAQRGACVLLYDEPLTELARERLKVVFDSNDGFEIARQDLRLRGPGEFLGARQWGLPLLRFADLERDAMLLERSRQAAAELLLQHPEAARRHVQRWLPQATGLLDA